MKAVAKAAGVSPATIYAWSSKGKWKRPPAPGVKAPAKGEQLAGRVRCPGCQTMTQTDPCDGCGKTLPRKW